jgi:23S rRNA pseudouridine1911/1915/1917 synthase
MKHRFTVTRAESGRTLAEWLRVRLKVVMPHALQLVRSRQVRVDGQPCIDPRLRLRPGQQVDAQTAPAPSRDPRGQKKAGGARRETRKPRDRCGPRPLIRYADEHIVVVDKPAGLTTMRHKEDIREFGERARRFLPPTLADLLPDLLGSKRPGNASAVRAVHRIDNETSGLVVFARNVEAERHLGRQFRAHSADRLYTALVRGQARSGRIESFLTSDRGDGRRGSTTKPGEGQRAVTHVRVLKELGEFTLVECRLETGRTHQVRIHLGEAGTPLCGERVYDRPPHGAPAPDESGAKRVLLHAARLGFEHPATGNRIEWSSPLPKDMADVFHRLQQKTRKIGERGV